MITVLNVAYPLSSVGPESVGGAEQVLSQLDRWLTEAGHRSIVVALSGSRTFGDLVGVACQRGVLDEGAVEAARRGMAAAVAEALEKYPIDLVHMHGVDFEHYMPSDGPPVLVTLHCPRDWYAEHALQPCRPDVWLNAVSPSQHELLLPNCRLLAPVENGVSIPNGPRPARGRFALALSRIAPEKGIEVAIRVTRKAGRPLLAAGKVFPYPAHLRYAADVLGPLLDEEHRLIGPVGGELKGELLASAACVIIPSLAEETSSLTAREALAAGTPVIAFRRGALAEIIENGVTGFLVDTEAEMVDALAQVESLDHDLCRETAVRRFSLEKMHQGYLSHYHSILAAAGRTDIP